MRKPSADREPAEVAKPSLASRLGWLVLPSVILCTVGAFAAVYHPRYLGFSVPALALLVGHAEQQGHLVPAGHRRADAGGHADGAAEGALDGRVAADVVGMGVGVEEAGQPPPAQGLPQQRDGLPGMANVAAVDEARRATVEQQHVVGRQPAPLQHLDGGRQMHARHAGPLSLRRRRGCRRRA